jgi:hypothetical protein
MSLIKYIGLILNLFFKVSYYHQGLGTSNFEYKLQKKKEAQQLLRRCFAR